MLLARRLAAISWWWWWWYNKILKKIIFRAFFLKKSLMQSLCPSFVLRPSSVCVERNSTTKRACNFIFHQNVENSSGTSKFEDGPDRLGPSCTRHTTILRKSCFYEENFFRVTPKALVSLDKMFTKLTHVQHYILFKVFDNRRRCKSIFKWNNLFL